MRKLQFLRQVLGCNAGIGRSIKDEEKSHLSESPESILVADLEIGVVNLDLISVDV